MSYNDALRVAVVLNTPRCVNCNRTECDGGPTCVPEIPDCPVDPTHTLELCEGECGYQASQADLDNALAEGYVDHDQAVSIAEKLISQTTVSLSEPIIRVTTTKGSNDMTELAADGTEVEPARFTQWSRYPLPPLPPRVRVIYDGYGRYKLPSPTTGRPTAYSRATTIADTMDETFNLNRWKRRNAVKAIFKAVEEQNGPRGEAQSNADGFDVAGGGATLASLLMDAIAAMKAEDDRALDSAIDMLDNLTGGRDAAELGEAVHAWLEAVDIGTVLPVDVPEMFQPYLAAYRDALRRAGLIPLAQYVERIVLNDCGDETIVGTIDRIFLCVTTGELVMGDVKTSKTLEYGWLTYSIQVGGVYACATKMLRADGDESQGQHGWEPMPEINQDYVVILHVPSDQPERAAAVTLDLFFGANAMITSMEVRRLRKDAKKAVPFVHEIPVPSKEALAYVKARDMILDVTNPAQLSDIWEQFQDVWDDSLTELGEHVAELLDAAATATV